MMKMGVLWIIVGSMRFVLVDTSLCASAQEVQLRLEEVGSWTVPDSFPLSGMASSAGGDLILWSSAADYLIQLDEQLDVTRRVQLPPGAKPSFACILSDHSVEFVVQGSAEIHRVSLESGQYSHTLPGVHTQGVVLGATRFGEKWVFVMRDFNGLILLHTHSLGDGEEEVFPGWEDAGTDSYAIASSDDEVVVTQRAKPHRVRVFDAGLQDRLGFDPALPSDTPEAVLSGNTPIEANWISLPAVPLDRGYVQTVADLTSDRRSLVLYDENGRTVRIVHLEVPLGVAISRPGRKVLFASRRTNKVEVVKYKWRWAHESY